MAATPSIVPPLALQPLIEREERSQQIPPTPWSKHRNTALFTTAFRVIADFLSHIDLASFGRTASLIHHTICYDNLWSMPKRAAAKARQVFPKTLTFFWQTYHRPVIVDKILVNSFASTLATYQNNLIDNITISPSDTSPLLTKCLRTHLDCHAFVARDAPHMLSILKESKPSKSIYFNVRLLPQFHTQTASAEIQPIEIVDIHLVGHRIYCLTNNGQLARWTIDDLDHPVLDCVRNVSSIPTTCMSILDRHSKIAIGLHNGQVLLWDEGNEKERAVAFQHTHAVTALQWGGTHDTIMLASGDAAGNIHVAWPQAKLDPIHIKVSDAAIHRLLFSRHILLSMSSQIDAIDCAFKTQMYDVELPEGTTDIAVLGNKIYCAAPKGLKLLLHTFD